MFGCGFCSLDNDVKKVETEFSKMVHSNGINVNGHASFEKVDGTVNVDCIFGEQSEDGTISAEILPRKINGRKYYATVGPLVMNIKPYLNLDIIITRPALSIHINPDFSINGEIVFEAGWKQGE